MSLVVNRLNLRLLYPLLPVSLVILSNKYSGRKNVSIYKNSYAMMQPPIERASTYPPFGGEEGCLPRYMGRTIRAIVNI